MKVSVLMHKVRNVDQITSYHLRRCRTPEDYALYWVGLIHAPEDDVLAQCPECDEPGELAASMWFRFCLDGTHCMEVLVSCSDTEACKSRVEKSLAQGDACTTHDWKAIRKRVSEIAGLSLDTGYGE